MRPAGPREYKNYAECKDVSLYSAGVESFCAERGSGSDKRIVSDSLYDDVQHLGFRGVRGDRFLTYPNRAGSLETCGFKRRFWPLLGLRPKVTRARGRGTLPVGDMEEKRTGRRGRRPLQRVRRKCAGIWYLAVRRCGLPGTPAPTGARAGPSANLRTSANEQIYPRAAPEREAFL